MNNNEPKITTGKYMTQYVQRRIFFQRMMSPDQMKYDFVIIQYIRPSLFELSLSMRMQR